MADEARHQASGRIPRSRRACIGKANPRAAIRFLEAADQAINLLADMPEMGGIWESNDADIQGLRVWSIRRFKKYLIFYRIMSGGIEVVRVLHGAQDLERVLKEPL